MKKKVLHMLEELLKRSMYFLQSNNHKSPLDDRVEVGDLELSLVMINVAKRSGVPCDTHNRMVYLEELLKLRVGCSCVCPVPLRTR